MSPEQARVKTGRTRKRRKGKARNRVKTLLGLDIEDELAQRDRHHRDKYTRENDTGRGWRQSQDRGNRSGCDRTINI